MIEIKNTAAGRGYVRAVFSGRCRGYAVPLDLVRVHLRAVARVALRARLAVAFAGYLVTDTDDDELRRLEIYGRKYEAKRPAFSGHRAGHQYGSSSLCMTGAKSPLDAAYRDVTGGPLDAPEFLPGGGCDELGALFCEPPQIIALREPLPDMERVEYISGPCLEPFAPGREKYAPGVDRLCVTGLWFVSGEQCGALDAPVFLPAGSFRCFQDREAGEVRAPRIVCRAGWL